MLQILFKKINRYLFYYKSFIIFVSIYLVLNVFVMEEKELSEIILELKTKLESKYGKSFSKFYLCEFNDGKWEGLISTKDDNGRTGSYYRIKEGIVEEETLN